MSQETVAKLLRAQVFSLQANAKTVEGGQHPDRDAQFSYLSDQAGEHLAAGEPVISVDNYATPSTPDIEDLLAPGEYLSFYNEAYGASLKLSDLTGKDRIVARITRKIGKEFNHGHVAAVFLRNLDKSIKSLSDPTLERFEKVIDALVKALPTE